MSELQYNHAVSQPLQFCFDAAPECHSRHIIMLSYSCHCRFVLIQFHCVTQLLYNYAVLQLLPPFCCDIALLCYSCFLSTSPFLLVGM